MKRMLSILLMLMLVPCAALAEEEDEPVTPMYELTMAHGFPLRRRAVPHAAMGHELPELPENALQQHHGDERDEGVLSA